MLWRMYLLGDVRDGCCVIKVETRRAQLVYNQKLRLEHSLGDQERVDDTPIQLVHERKGGHPIVRGMNASVTNNSLPSVLQHTT